MSSGIPSEELLYEIQHARAAGRDVHVDRGLAAEEIAAIERKVDSLLPLALRDLFRMTAGFSVDGLHVDFHCKDMVPLALSHMLRVAEGRDAVWAIGFDRSGWCPVVCVSVRPAVIAIQADGVTQFIPQVFAPERPHGIIAPALAEIATSNAHARAAGLLVDAEDPVVRAFARELDPADVITDLRRQHIGVGFVWHASSDVRQAPGHLVFATAAQPS